jgi:lipopolysaccharide export LptBFGC system permease protein LptF
MTAGDSYSARWARRALDGDAPASAGETAYYARIMRQATLPMLPLVMLMFAIPITAMPHNGRGRITAAVYAATAGSLFLVIDSLMNVMAMLGTTPAMTGVWLVPIEAAMLATCVIGWI